MLCTGSDPNAALYWMGRMLEAGELFSLQGFCLSQSLSHPSCSLAISSSLSLALASHLLPTGDNPLYVARRLIRFASEGDLATYVVLV